MTATVLGLFGVCLAAALAEILLPGEEGRGTKTALRALTALAVLLLISRPILPYFQKSFDFSLEMLLGDADIQTEQYEAVFENALRAGGEQELNRALLALLEEEYGIGQEDAHVKVYFDETGAPTHAKITLSGMALLVDPDEIAADVSARLDCETEVR